MDLAARGATALKEGNYEEAITQYTGALSSNPKAVDYYIKRSTAYQRSAKYPEALSDAEVAVVLAHERAKRELIKEAQLRRAIALFFLERYADADFVLQIVKRLDEKEKTLQIWTMKIEAKLKGLAEDDERRKVTAKEVPEVALPTAPAKTTKTEESTEKAVEGPKPPVPTPANKIKHDWYQNNEFVYFTLMAKGVPKDRAVVEIEKNSLSISFPIQDSSDYDYTLDPFFQPVDPTASSFRITPTKVEITLKKSQPGIKWKALEGDQAQGEASTETGNQSSIPSHILSSSTSDAPPAYPTSSRKGAKDWDKVAKDLTKTKQKKKKKEGGGGSDEEDVGYDEMDEYDGDETSRFFKHLFKGSSPDQQRAMMKSYQESGGTVLSTDWSSVGSKTVVPEPPEGMEAKKY